MVFHGNRKNFYNRDKMYPLMGFEKYYSLECFENPKIIGLGMDDKDLFQRITKILKEKVKRKELFYSFVITITSHHRGAPRRRGPGPSSAPALRVRKTADPRTCSGSHRRRKSRSH